MNDQQSGPNTGAPKSVNASNGNAADEWNFTSSPTGEAPDENQGAKAPRQETLPASSEEMSPKPALSEKTAADPAIEPEKPLHTENSETPKQEKQIPADTTTMPPAGGGAWNSLFNGFSKGGPVLLLIAMFCMAWHDFYNPANAVYCPPEFRSITAFLHCISQNSWTAPMGLENGEWLTAQWPGFFWFIGLLALIPGLGVSSLLLPVAEFTAAGLAVIAIWLLSHSTRMGSRCAFAAGIMALCCPLFAPLPHFMGPAALSTAFMLFALVFFYKGWRSHYSFFSLPLAFIFTAMAGLTGGILPFATPLVASFCFLIWGASFRRAQRLDALFGFVLLLAIIGGWLGWVMLNGTNDQYLSALFDLSTRPAWPPFHFWWLAVAAGIGGSMPWLLTIFGVSWIRVFSKSGESLKASRHDNGSALVWISFVTACLISVWMPYFHSAAIAVCALLLILLGKAFMKMPAPGNRFFFFLAALATTCVGLFLLAMHFDFSQNWILENTRLPLPEIVRNALLNISGVPVLGGILVVGGLTGFYFSRRFCHAGGLLYALLLAIILCQPGRLLIVPELAANPDLPVRKYDAIVAAVEKALATQATSASEQPGVPEMPTQTVPPADTPVPVQPNINSPALPEAGTPLLKPGESEKIIIIETPDQNGSHPGTGGITPPQTAEPAPLPAISQPTETPVQEAPIITQENVASPAENALPTTNPDVNAPLPAESPASHPDIPASPEPQLQPAGGQAVQPGQPGNPAEPTPETNAPVIVEEVIIEKETPRRAPDMFDHPTTGGETP